MSYQVYPTARINEVYAKVIAYNLTRVIHGVYEHGVIPEFLRDQSALESLK